jgi:glycyl-tRNA synthetase beta chain
MAKHEKFFPILDGDGSITNGFVSITNCGDPDTVRRGNEWVLNARFNDAKFYFDEDSLVTLKGFLEKTSRIVFQEKLGTVRQRADRLASLAASFAKDAGLSDSEVQRAETAGRLAKADLSTGLVSELPALQGKVGGAYARRDAYDEAICEAISEHYDAPPSNALATIVMCADQADRLAGYLGMGHAPKGSSDPYGLRRAMTVLVEAQRDWAMPKKSIADWIRAARAEYEKQEIALPMPIDFSELLFSRYEAIFDDIPYDAMLAAWCAKWDEPTASYLRRAKCMASLSKDVDFVRTGKRPANIVESARKKGLDITEEVSESLFDHEEEHRLMRAAASARMAMGGELDENIFVSELRKLAPAIDAFFDKVMVMVDDSKKRSNRLGLLRSVDELFRKIGDFSKIVIEGE